MTDRRAFLQMGLVASTLPWVPGLTAAAPVAVEVLRPARLPLYKVFYDGRYPESRAFGAEAARRGAAVAGLPGGDITGFWFSDLDLRWRARPDAIAGFTRQGPLVALERLAGDRGLQDLFRAEHRVLDSGTIEHRLVCQQPTLSHAMPLIGAGEQWSRVMAAVVTRCVAGSPDGTSRTLVTQTGWHAQDDEPFYSWVIAPRG